MRLRFERCSPDGGTSISRNVASLKYTFMTWQIYYIMNTEPKIKNILWLFHYTFPKRTYRITYFLIYPF